MTTQDLAATPSPEFWEGTLYFDEFGTVLARLGDPQNLDDALASLRRAGCSKVLERVLSEVGGAIEVRQNLALAHAFLEDKRSDAVEYVAEATGDADLLARHRKATADGAEEYRRLPLAIELFSRDPRHLLAIDLWSRWHGRARSVYSIIGPQRRFREALVHEWQLAAETAVAELRENETAHVKGIDHMVVLQRARPWGILVALCEFPSRTLVRDDKGVVVAGVRPNWSFIFFHDRGNVVDVTDDHPDRGATIAGSIGWKFTETRPEYRLARDAVDDEVLGDLLSKLIDPAFDELPLLEIEAAFKWHPSKRPLTLSGTGQERVELALKSLRDIGDFVDSWTEVDHVKVGFEKHRFLIQFPKPGGDRCVRYVDQDRSKALSTRFEEHFFRVMRARIHPKGRRSEMARGDDERPMPKRHSVDWWDLALSPGTDAPPAAMIELWDSDPEIRKFGEPAFFQIATCSDQRIPRTTDRDNVACRATVEAPWNRATDENPFWLHEEDPHRAAADGTLHCSAVEPHVWRAVRHKVARQIRVRVSVRHDVVWGHLVEQLRRVGETSLRAHPALAVLQTSEGHLFTVVYAPLLSSADLADASLVKTAKAVWIVGLEHAVPVPARGRAVSVSQAMANIDAIDEVLDLGVSAGRRQHALRQADRAASAPSAAAPSVRVVQVDANGVFLGGARIADKHAGTTARLFRLLWRAARQDDETARGLRAWWRAEDLISAFPAEAEGLTENALQVWVSRARTEIAQLTGDDALKCRIIESERGRGYRLGDGFECIVTGMKGSPTA